MGVEIVEVTYLDPLTEDFLREKVKHKLLN